MLDALHPSVGVWDIHRLPSELWFCRALRGGYKSNKDVSSSRICCLGGVPRCWSTTVSAFPEQERCAVHGPLSLPPSLCQQLETEKGLRVLALVDVGTWVIFDSRGTH